MTNELNKIKQRIRALSLKTTSNGCTEEEALAAMEKVGELLEIYNLNLSEVHFQEETCIEERVYLRRRTLPNWCFIFSTVGAFTRTKPWTSRPDIHYFGFEPDVQMAVYLTNVILDALETETRKFQKTATYRNSYQRRHMTRSFKTGLISRLNDRLVVAAPKGKGIVVHKMAYIEDQLAQQKPELKLRTRRTKRSMVNRSAYQAGQAAGDNVNLNRPVGQSSDGVAGYLS